LYMFSTKNPYTPGAGTQPPELTGRDELVEQFGFTIARLIDGIPGQSLIPVGLRGVGKTVLLNVFEKQAESAGAVTEHLEADQDTTTPDVLARRMRSALYKLAPRDSWGRGAVARALGVVSSVYMTFAPHGVSFGVAIEPLTGVGDSGDLREDFIDLFVAVGEAAREHKRGVVLAIDEVQNLSNDVFRAVIMGLHRCSQLNLPVMLVGAGLPTIKGKAGDVKTYSERLFQFPEIGSLDEDDAVRALVAPAERFGVRFSDPAVESILERSLGYPYFLQEWGFGVWNAAEGPVISYETVQWAETAVQMKLDESFFGVRMGRLTPQERQYLRVMADLGPGPYRSASIAEAMDKGLQQVAPTRGRLINKGMIWSGEYGEIAFTVPLFDEYLKRNVPRTTDTGLTPTHVGR
jgi:hypothetical protein